ncbi:MAG: cytochrome c [Ferruginibacter sp.]|nr:cytochrome c [Ferruginibacter sp.]
MKRTTFLPAIIITAVVAIASSCDGHRSPGKIYMPDMAYSRAYESYAQHDSMKFTMDMNDKGGNKIFYNSMPAAGTIKRGEFFPYTLPNDSTGYKMSATVKNPLDSINAKDLTEAGRLFNINCAICHGEKGAANGPLATSGKIGGVANLTLPAYTAMADGTMFHSITYGKNNMGSYASQLTREQRWMIVKYVRTLQPKAAGTTAPAAADSTAKKP